MKTIRTQKLIAAALAGALVFTTSAAVPASSPAKAPAIETRNPFLYEGSASPMGHWDPHQSDASVPALPLGNRKVDPSKVSMVYGNLINWPFGHRPLPDGQEIAWFSGPTKVGKIRMDGGRFELIGELVVPGFEETAPSTEAIKRLLDEMDAAGSDEMKLRGTFLKGVKAAGLGVANTFYGGYYLLDRDGFYYTVYDTRLIKFGDAEPGNPLSGPKIVKQLDAKAALPTELAAKVSRLIGINITWDGRIVIAMSGLMASVDRDLGDLKFIALPGEAIDNHKLGT